MMMTVMVIVIVMVMGMAKVPVPSAGSQRRYSKDKAFLHHGKGDLNLIVVSHGYDWSWIV